MQIRHCGVIFKISTISEYKSLFKAIKSSHGIETITSVAEKKDGMTDG